MIEHILFDLDGTLTDPAEGITGAVAHSLQKLGITPPPRKELECFIGPPLNEAFGEKFGLAGDTLEQAVVYFREYFAPKGIWENELYPGIPEMLAALKDAGFTLYVATSKPTRFATQILQHFHIDSFFSDVQGSPLTHHGLPKADIIRQVLGGAKIAPHTAVMVGDRKHDVLGAQQTGLASVGVLYGYGSLEELRQAAAGHIAPDVPALQAVLLAMKGA